MKKNRLLVVLLLAVVTGGLAGWLALTQLRSQAVANPAAEQRSGRVRMAVAARDMPHGTLLRTEGIRLIDWPADVLPMGYAASAADLVGRGLITPVRANEPLLSSKLADRESGGGMPILIPDGMRAISVRVDEVIQVAGFVTAGTRVDVMVTMKPTSSDSESITRVILQNMQVLAADQTIERDAEGKPMTVGVITLMVTPEQGERLAMAANEGRIQLALRGALDAQEVNTTGVRANALVQAPRTGGGGATTSRQVSVPSAPRERGTVVETFRGGVRTLNTF
jgi:pilus assembly protein CpaB